MIAPQQQPCSKWIAAVKQTSFTVIIAGIGKVFTKFLISKLRKITVKFTDWDLKEKIKNDS